MRYLEEQGPLAGLQEHCINVQHDLETLAAQMRALDERQLRADERAQLQQTRMADSERASR